MADIIQTPQRTQILVKDGKPTTVFLVWLDQITRAVQPPLMGDGTPESMVVAQPGVWYVDTQVVGGGLYLKESGNGDTGWTLRS